MKKESDCSAGSEGANRVELNRRDFVYAIGAVVGLVSVGEFAKPVPSSSRLIRPPGAQSESTFISLCTRCDRCRSACPTKAIAPARLEDGLIAVRTPKLNFKLGWCNFCGECAEVCPTGALPAYQASRFGSDVLPDKEFFKTTLVIGLAVVNKDRCIAYERAGSCIICSTKCPYKAITLDEYRRPQINLGLCNGCGVCENICPSSRLLSFKGGLRRGIEVQTGSI